jgi:hypothetical protein
MEHLPYWGTRTRKLFCPKNSITVSTFAYGYKHGSLVPYDKGVAVFASGFVVTQIQRNLPKFKSLLSGGFEAIWLKRKEPVELAL